MYWAGGVDGLVVVGGRCGWASLFLAEFTHYDPPAIRGCAGQATDIEIQAREILRLRERLNEIYVHHTGQKLADVEKAMERDNFMSAKEAKKFGLIDEVVENHVLADDDKKK